MHKQYALKHSVFSESSCFTWIVESHTRDCHCIDSLITNFFLWPNCSALSFLWLSILIFLHNSKLLKCPLLSLHKLIQCSKAREVNLNYTVKSSYHSIYTYKRYKSLLFQRMKLKSDIGHFPSICGTCLNKNGYVPPNCPNDKCARARTHTRNCNTIAKPGSEVSTWLYC